MTGPVCHSRRAAHAAAPILPATVLLVLPKCPLCLAAWLALANGVTVNAATAAWLRNGVLVLWGAATAALLWRNWARRNRSPAR